MITIVMRPVKDAKTVNYEGLYSAELGGAELCRVRAKNARHAEEKLVETLKFNVPAGTVIDYNLEKFKEERNVHSDGGGVVS